MGLPGVLITLAGYTDHGPIPKHPARVLDGNVILTKMNPIGARGDRQVNAIVHNDRHAAIDRAQDPFKTPQGVPRGPEFIPQLDNIHSVANGFPGYFK